MDKSDELEERCPYVSFDNTYAKESVPKANNDEPLIVYANVSILALPFIETVNLKFTVDLVVSMRWHDYRLEFRQEPRVPK